MSDREKEQIKIIVNTFADIGNIKDVNVRERLIEKLCNLSIGESIDYILVALEDLVNRKVLKMDDIINNIGLITVLDPSKYSTLEDLLERREYLKTMNVEHTQMSLPENHELVMRVFDEFNKLVGVNFDTFYTGGLMGYITTGHELERYHSDLDIFINEDQMFEFVDSLKENPDFEFISSMDYKNDFGHEYRVKYKDSPMSIGLFLFKRLENGEIVTKEYYYPEHRKENGLHMHERHLNKEYASLTFDQRVREYNGHKYKMFSLESIYNMKKNGRPKDKYDASIIKDYVDLDVDRRIDECEKENYDIKGLDASDTIIQALENELSHNDGIKLS